MHETLPFVQLGTRASALARRQTTHVAGCLQAAWPGLRLEVRVITTRGDRILDTPLPLVGGKGLFTAELEAALRSGAIDLAVHSLKDLPTTLPAGLAVGVVPRRANSADVLVSRRGYTLETLPRGATIGTSSRRRAAQLLYRRPDLCLVDIRGNVDTRIRKALDSGEPYDAIVLAYAGLERLGRLAVVSQELSLEQMLPAPGQGALGIQHRDEAGIRSLLAPLDDRDAAAAVAAERSFLARLGGGCAVPIAAYGHVEQGRLHLRGRVTALDGTAQIDVSGAAQMGSRDRPILPLAEQLGAELARAALARGAAALLQAAA